MSADVTAFWLVVAMAPFVTINAVLYAGFFPWYRSMVGWRIMFESFGLAALVDISLLYQWLGDDYALRDVVRLSVFTTVLLGAVFGTLTLTQAMFVRNRNRRTK